MLSMKIFPLYQRVSVSMVGDFIFVKKLQIQLYMRNQ